MLNQPGRSPEERRVAICIFDDIVEHAGEGGQALQYISTLFPHVLAAAVDKNAEVRQVSGPQ